MAARCFSILRLNANLSAGGSLSDREKAAWSCRVAEGSSRDQGGAAVCHFCGGDSGFLPVSPGAWNMTRELMRQWRGSQGSGRSSCSCPESPLGADAPSGSTCLSQKWAGWSRMRVYSRGSGPRRGGHAPELGLAERHEGMAPRWSHRLPGPSAGASLLGRSPRPPLGASKGERPSGLH